LPVGSRLAVLRAVDPSKKMSVPVGVPVLLVPGVTVAVRVMLAPTFALEVDALSVVVVLVGGAACTMTEPKVQRAVIAVFIVRTWNFPTANLGYFVTVLSGDW
jgi:hypothetical protein